MESLMSVWGHSVYWKWQDPGSREVLNVKNNCTEGISAQLDAVTAAIVEHNVPTHEKAVSA